MAQTHVSDPSPLRFEHGDVSSDHAEVRCRFLDVSIAMWNACNPTFFYNFTGTSPFRNTHMAIPKEQIPNHPWLAEKTFKQTHWIASSLKSGSVHAFIVPEAFDDLIAGLRGALSDRYGFVYRNRSKPGGHCTLIVYDRDAEPFKGQDVEEDVIEIAVEGDKPYHLPRISTPNLSIIGVHVPGNEAQYPAEALEALGKRLGTMVGAGTSAIPVFVGGDWNTIPSNALKHMPQGSTAVTTTTPTHINPFSETVVYDYAILLGGAPGIDGIEMTVGAASVPFVYHLVKYRP